MDGRIEKLFGPVISIMQTKKVDKALAIGNANPYRNAAGVTQNDGMAAQINIRASAGMIGVIVGVPVPRAPVSWLEGK